jgi:hypothetical protein
MSVKVTDVSGAISVPIIRVSYDSNLIIETRE